MTIRKSYVDAVMHRKELDRAAERRRPKLSSFHMNQYQTTGIAHGAPTTHNGRDNGIPLADWPAGTGGLDIRKTALGQDVTHRTIDDHALVKDAVHEQLKRELDR